MAKQTFTTGQVLTAAQMNSLQANDYNQTVDVKTANYTLVAADKGKRIEFNTSGSVTCTVNTGLFDAGDTVIIQNRGAGSATVTAGTATVNTNATLALGQYAAGTLYFVSASAAIFFGDASGIAASAFTAKGDLLVGTGNGTFDKLTVGANNTTIVADSTETTGLKWAAPSGASFKGVRISKSADQNISNATGTAVTFDTEQFDTDAFHSTSTNTDRITIPAGLGGKYLIVYGIQIGNNGNGYREFETYKNGVTRVADLKIPGFALDSYWQGSTVLDLTAGDYINFTYYQNSGGSLILGGGIAATFVSAVYLGA